SDLDHKSMLKPNNTMECAQRFFPSVFCMRLLAWLVVHTANPRNYKGQGDTALGDGQNHPPTHKNTRPRKKEESDDVFLGSTTNNIRGGREETKYYNVCPSLLAFL